MALPLTPLHELCFCSIFENIHDVAHYCKNSCCQTFSYSNLQKKSDVALRFFYLTCLRVFETLLSSGTQLKFHSRLWLYRLVRFFHTNLEKSPQTELGFVHMVETQTIDTKSELQYCLKHHCCCWILPFYLSVCSLVCVVATGYNLGVKSFHFSPSGNSEC